VLGVVLVAAARPVGHLLHLGGLAPLLLLSAASLPFFGAASVHQARLQRQLRFRSLALGEILSAFVSLAFAVGWLLWRPGPAALVAGQASLAVARCVLLGALSDLRPSFRLRRSDLRPLAAFGAFQMGDRTLNHAAGNLDRVLVSALLGPAAAGYYAMASQIALRPMTLLGPFIARTLLPLLARLQGDRARMAAAYLRSTSLLSFCSAGVFTLLFGAAAPLLRALLGPGWEPAVPALRLFAILGALLAGGNALGNLALALGRAGTNFWINVAVLAGRAAAVAIGARFGVTGAAVGMLVVTALTLPLDFILPRSWLGVRPGALARAATWSLIPAAAAAWGMTVLATRMHLPAIAETLVAIPAGCALFLVTAWVMQRKRLAAALLELREKFLKGR
jgi:O-antigen/teichoic acid export membrane protein